ncbi:hypothetical protein Btru_048642 [Bulinus truncatus]|nr:hypothetical protein Btru_048642 [Bulinus truncatus]
MFNLLGKIFTFKIYTVSLKKDVICHGIIIHFPSCCFSSCEVQLKMVLQGADMKILLTTTYRLLMEERASSDFIRDLRPGCSLSTEFKQDIVSRMKKTFRSEIPEPDIRFITVNIPTKKY